MSRLFLSGWTGCFNGVGELCVILPFLPPSSDHVKSAATIALLNSLEFTKANFDITVSVVRAAPLTLRRFGAVQECRAVSLVPCRSCRLAPCHIVSCWSCAVPFVSRRSCCADRVLSDRCDAWRRVACGASLHHAGGVSCDAWRDVTCDIMLQVERHFIMQVVCEATQSTHSHVSVAALQCLVKIMSLYYQYMEHYMGPALFAVSPRAIPRSLLAPPPLYSLLIPPSSLPLSLPASLIPSPSLLSFLHSLLTSPSIPPSLAPSFPRSSPPRALSSDHDCGDGESDWRSCAAGNRVLVERLWRGSGLGDRVLRGTPAPPSVPLSLSPCKAVEIW